jgi:outer membrane protein, heavy metal efflux system
MTPRATILLAVLLCVGCRVPMPCCQRPMVSSELSSRVGAELGSNCGISHGTIPPGLEVADGISEQEAVTIALWNNASLGELLAQLGISRAQLYVAGLISDPQLVLLLPQGPKQFEFTTFQAVDALWLRPIDNLTHSLLIGCVLVIVVLSLIFV